MNPLKISSASFIPPELIEEFIDALATEDVDSLKTLSQTSSLFLPRCRRHLFASIELRGSGHSNMSQSLVRKARNLHQVLVRAPVIANYIQTLRFVVYKFNGADAHIIAQLLLQFSAINTFTLHSGTSHTPCDWALVAPELQFALSRLTYLPTVKTFTLIALNSFPVTFFAPCTNIAHLTIFHSVLEDSASPGDVEAGSIAQLQSLNLYRNHRGVERLISGRRPNGSPILDFSHLRTVDAHLIDPETLPAIQELLKRASQLESLCFKVYEEVGSLSGIFQTASSLQRLKCLKLNSSVESANLEDPLFGLSQELRVIERCNGLEEIVIDVFTALRFVRHEFLGDLNNVLTLPGYSQLRRLHLEILLWDVEGEEYDREGFKQELEDAARKQCSQLFNKPSLTFTYIVTVES